MAHRNVKYRSSGRRNSWDSTALWIDWFIDNSALRDRLGDFLPTNMHSLRKELMVWATREEDGVAWGLERRDISLHDQVLASCASAGVCPD